MLKLSFDNLPHYIYSSNRQFLPNEKHLNRIFNEDVLILMHKGVLLFTENDVPVELHAGEYYIQRAGLYQKGVLASLTPNYFYFHFNGSFSESGRLPIRGFFNNDNIRPLIQKIERLGNESPKLEYEKYFYTVLSELCKQQHDDTTAEKIRNFLLTHYTEPITLDDICNNIFFSKNQIINVFRTAYGKTPHRYLTDYRLDKACELLLSTIRTIENIAFSVGFDEYSVFYRAFIAKYGISPTDYRKIC